MVAQTEVETRFSDRISANQFDLSFESYFDRDTAIALAFFYKDMDTFITQARTESGTTG